jgi:hypothetical protein
LIFWAAAVIAAASLIVVGRVAWEEETRAAADKEKDEVFVAQAAQKIENVQQPANPSTPQGSTQGAGSNQDADQRIQQLLDRYGDNVQCTDFETQQQAEEVFEADQILFGDALDSDVNGIACDEGDFLERSSSSHAQWPVPTRVSRKGPGHLLRCVLARQWISLCIPSASYIRPYSGRVL